MGVVEYFFNPDFPENTRAFYITKEEAGFARKRLIDDGYVGTMARQLCSGRRRATQLPCGLAMSHDCRWR
jgi:hypothetical protein